MRPAGGVEAFVAARGHALLRLAWLLTGDVETARDVVQDALARVLPRWDAVVAKGEPEPYVRAAVRSAAVDHWRRARRGLDTVPDVPEQAREDERVEGAAVRLGVAAALARLTPRQRAVLVLRFYEDLTEVQTAQALGCSVSTVKSQARHAISRLRVLAPELVLLHDDRLGHGSTVRLQEVSGER